MIHEKTVSAAIGIPERPAAWLDSGHFPLQADHGAYSVLLPSDSKRDASQPSAAGWVQDQEAKVHRFIDGERPGNRIRNE